MPEGDLIAMLTAVERLRYRTEALDDLEWDGLVVTRQTGDERVVSITEGGASRPPMPYMARAEMAMAKDTSVSPGESTLSVNLDVVFDLGK